MPSRHFDFDLGTAELLGFRGSWLNAAPSRDCHCFQLAVRPDTHEHGQPSAQSYSAYSDGYTIPDGNCYSAAQPYAGSGSFANYNGNTSIAAQ